MTGARWLTYVAAFAHPSASVAGAMLTLTTSALSASVVAEPFRPLPNEMTARAALLAYPNLPKISPPVFTPGQRPDRVRTTAPALRARITTVLADPKFERHLVSDPTGQSPAIDAPIGWDRSMPTAMRPYTIARQRFVVPPPNEILTATGDLAQ